MRGQNPAGARVRRHGRGSGGMSGKQPFRYCHAQPPRCLNLLGEGAYRMPQFHSRQAAVAGRHKTTNYLPNALMTREARERGVDVSFSFDEHDFLAEAAIANVGVIDGRGRLLMPRFTHALPGTTALLAMEIAGTMMEVIITDITEEILYAASEILIFGTGPECVAVTRYEGKPVGNRGPPPVRRGAGSARSA